MACEARSVERDHRGDPRARSAIAASSFYASRDHRPRAVTRPTCLPSPRLAVTSQVKSYAMRGVSDIVLTVHYSKNNALVHPHLSRNRDEKCIFRMLLALAEVECGSASENRAVGATPHTSPSTERRPASTHPRTRT
jgi:hypothetical protein